MSVGGVFAVEGFVTSAIRREAGEKLKIKPKRKRTLDDSGKRTRGWPEG